MTAPTLLPPARRTLPGLLEHIAAHGPERPLLTIGEQHWRRADAAAIAAARAGALAEGGIATGDRVALMCGNRAEFLETFLGCGWLGAVAVPINTASMAPQIEYLLRNSGTRLLVVEVELLERLALIDWKQTAVQAVWVVGADTDAALAPTLPGGRHWPAPGQPLAPAPVRPGDTLAILYTSGTTGPSKGVMCPHAQYVWWGVNSGRVLDLRPDDVLCTTLPLFHINALNTFAQAAVNGCHAVFEGRFSASRFWERMQAHRASVVYLLGAMVPILLAQPVTAAEQGHGVRVGLAPGSAPADIARFRERTGVALLEGYGSTETNFVIAGTQASSGQAGMGWVVEGFEARVVDAEDNELPVGEAGELVLRASEPYAFASGYFGMPEKTVEAWRNLWFHTGDRVLRQPDGSLRFVDRIKDAIRRRGENISSWEVEQALSSHPLVVEVAVYPVKSELAEDEVMAAVVARQGLAPEALWAHCAERLPKFAVPRYLDFRADLPRTENGKVQKYKLREQGVTVGSTHDRGAR